MNVPEYAPLHPSMTHAFETALKEHRTILAELLVGADALQEATFQALCLSSAQRCELDLLAWEIALGQGAEAAQVAALMAGYLKAENGGWTTGSGGKVTKLCVPPSLLVDHLKDWAVAI